MKLIICFPIDWLNIHLSCYYNFYDGIARHVKLFEKNNITVEFLHDCLTENELKNVTSKNFLQLQNKAIEQFLNILNNSNKYDNSILLGFRIIGTDFMFGKNYKIFKEKNIKLWIWMDDLYMYRSFPDKNTYDSKKDYSKCGDGRFDKADKILTGTKNYLESLNSHYLEKTDFWFFNLNENYFDTVPINNFETRKTKILLSGALGIYPVRKQLYDIKINEKNSLAKYIDSLSHPGYQNDTKTHQICGEKYLLHISQYKGAFVGLGESILKTLHFKHLEILASGTIGFFEQDSILEKYLGLKPFVHYVPIMNDKGELITDEEYYLKYLNSQEGENIAITGALHVRQNFSSMQQCLKLIKIIHDSI